MEIMLTKDKDKMKWDRQEETKVIRMKIKHLMEKVIMEQHKNRKKKNEIIDIDSDDGVEIVEVQVNRSGS